MPRAKDSMMEYHYTPEEIGMLNAEIDRLRTSLDNAVTVQLKLAKENERLRAAGDAAFYAMCAYRDSPDKEVFQDAIDALGIALNERVGG
jgi:hypothetical protein